MSSFRYVAPAGAPLTLLDLGRAAGFVLRRDDVEQALGEALQMRFGIRHAFFTFTGRAGMTLLLRAMRRLSPERDEVIVPSYTCYSVAASIVKAGMRPRLVDVSEATLDYDLAQLKRADFSRVLAVIATNLYGYPDDLAAISAIAHAEGAFVIDDAAQAMGARRAGAHAGTRGDAGLFSFDKGKNVSAIDGGVVVTNSPAVASAMKGELSRTPAAHSRDAMSGVLKAVAYWALLHPRFYWIPNSMPQLGLGRTVFTTDFPLAKPTRPLVALALAAFRHLDELTRARRRNASALVDGLRGVPDIQLPHIDADAEPACLRFPVLMPDVASRDAAVQRLNAAGIGATGSYPASLADVKELKPLLAGNAGDIVAGRSVAARIVTLPTHRFVATRDLSQMVRVIGAERPLGHEGMNLCVE